MPLAQFHDQFPRLCERLLQAKLRSRIAHAYLFVGDDVEFLERFASAWAEVCACVSPLADGNACGACAPCLLLAAGNYPERYDLRPQSRSRRIVVDDVRAFEHQLGLTVPRDRTKLGVIVEAECMGEEAQNAFLKTLEEPSPRTLLLLLSTQPRGLLPTIRSRCQTISLRRNIRSYENALRCGVFPALARLHRNAGAAAGLAVAHQLAQLFGSMHAQAEQAVGAEIDERWASVSLDDAVLKKRLEEERIARVEAEYLRLRRDVADAIQTWFLQLCLVAAGTARADLPHPEIIEAAEDEAGQLPVVSRAEADQNVELTTEFLRYLSASVNERLALDSFCLAVTQRDS